MTRQPTLSELQNDIAETIANAKYQESKAASLSPTMRDLWIQLRRTNMNMQEILRRIENAN